MQPVLLCVGAVLLLQPALTLAFSDVDDAGDSGFDRSRRGWSMMRLGRGLQMLRLGKRASSSTATGSAPATPEQMRELLATLVDEERNDFRRQPPLPRYGREIELAEDSANDLYSLLGDAYAFRIVPVHYSRYLHGSRFKRAAANSATTYQDQGLDVDQSLAASRIRAVALPRIGRYLGRQFRLQNVLIPLSSSFGRQIDDLSNKQVPTTFITGQYITPQTSSYSKQPTADSSATQMKS